MVVDSPLIPGSKFALSRVYPSLVTSGRTQRFLFGAGNPVAGKVLLARSGSGCPATPTYSTASGDWSEPAPLASIGAASLRRHGATDPWDGAGYRLIWDVDNSHGISTPARVVRGDTWSARDALAARADRVPTAC